MNILLLLVALTINGNNPEKPHSNVNSVNQENETLDPTVVACQACAAGVIGLFLHPLGAAITIASIFYGGLYISMISSAGVIGGIPILTGVVLNFIGNRKNILNKGAIFGAFLGTILYIPFDVIAIASVLMGGLAFVLSQGNVKEIQYLAIAASSIAIGSTLFTVSSLIGYYYFE